MSAHMAPLAYLNGQYIPSQVAALPVWDRGVVQGATVTEMIRTFQRSPFRLAQHLARLRQSLEYLGTAISESDDQLEAIVDHLIQSHAASLAPQQDLGLVILVTPGVIPMYAGDLPTDDAPTVCVHAFPLPCHQWAAKYERGQSLIVPSIRQIPSEILDPRFKYRSRLHWYLADREAQSIDPRAVALLQNTRGFLTETNSGNFFVVTQGTICTAREIDSLPGISQQFVKELALELEIPYEVGDITLDTTRLADEAFVTSTTYCLLPVTQLNQRPVGTGQPGSVALRLLKQWSDVIGMDIVQQAQRDLPRNSSPRDHS